MLRIFLTCLVGLFLSCTSANAQNAFRIFQGQAFFIAVDPVCGPGTAQNYNVGQFFTVIYRQKMESLDPPDALVLASERSAFRVQSQDPTGTLNGSVTTVNGGIGARANFYTNATSQTNLVLTSMSGASLTAANGIKVVGTINDFFNTIGCTVTIRGGVTLRPD